MKYTIVIVGAICLLQIVMVNSQGEGGRGSRGGSGGMDPLMRMMLSGGRRGGRSRMGSAGLLAASRGGMEFNDILPFLLMRNMGSGSGSGSGRGGSLFGGKGGMGMLPMMALMGGMDLGI